MKLTADMNDLSDADAWLVVTPAAFFRETLAKAVNSYNNQPVIICTKGAESSTGQFMSEILQAELPECKDMKIYEKSNYNGLWVQLFVRPLAYLIIKLSLSDIDHSLSMRTEFLLCAKLMFFLYG